MNLNTEQITHIAWELERSGLKDMDLHAELLDHISCEIEADMAKGNTFLVAYQQTIEAYHPKTVKRVQAQSQRARQSHKAVLMLKVTILSSLLLISIFLSWGYFHEKKQMPIIEAVEATAVFCMQNPAGSDAPILSSFGFRMHPVLKFRKMHLGVDFKIAQGSTIFAAETGIVTKIDWGKSRYGKQMIISHQDSFLTRYAHLSEFLVEVGDSVKKGELIAHSGNTGLSKGPHLHFELHKNGKAIDPLPWIDRKKSLKEIEKLDDGKSGMD